MTTHHDTGGELAAAYRRTYELAGRSARIDRRSWDRQMWVADARQLMDHADGSVACLLNGHILALFAELDARTPRPGPDCAFPTCHEQARAGHVMCIGHDHVRVADTGSWVGDRHTSDDQEDNR